jgi:hypothetical protein
MQEGSAEAFWIKRVLSPWPKLAIGNGSISFGLFLTMTFTFDLSFNLNTE